MTIALHRRSRLLCVAALACAAAGAAASAADTLARRAAASDIRARVVELVNEARSRGRRCGSERFAAAPPLRASLDLDATAAGHARDMARR